VLALASIIPFPYAMSRILSGRKIKDVGFP
jgi:hypothetical protein